MLTVSADQLGSAEDKAKWVAEEQDLLPPVFDRMQSRFEAGKTEGIEDADAAGSFAVAMLKSALGERSRAKQLLRCSHEIQETKLGRDDGRVAYFLYGLGLCVQKAGRLVEAEELLRRCLAIVEAKLRPEDARVTRALCSLGVCVQEAGRLHEAEELLRLFLRIPARPTECAGSLHSTPARNLRPRGGTAGGSRGVATWVRGLQGGQASPTEYKEDIQHVLHDELRASACCLAGRL